MFTGIIEEIGNMHCVAKKDDVHHYRIHAAAAFIQDIQLGDSISVNGVCLTAHELEQDAFHVDVSIETQKCTAFGQTSEDRQVNLERAVTPTTRLGGHLVSGHIDGLGTVNERIDNENETKLWIQCPGELVKYIAIKGSICINGVSLTVNEVKGDLHSITIIPHTLENTTLNMIQAGDVLNIEVDLVARYLEKLINNKS